MPAVDTEYYILDLDDRLNPVGTAYLSDLKEELNMTTQQIKNYINLVGGCVYHDHFTLVEKYPDGKPKSGRRSRRRRRRQAQM